MLALPLLGDARILLCRGDLVVECQETLLPLSLRAGRDKGRLDEVVHQCIGQRGGNPSTSNVGQPGSMPIGAWLLEVKDKQDPVILVFRANAVAIEDLGGELVWIACQIIEEHHRDLISLRLYLIRPRHQLLNETLRDGSRCVYDAVRGLSELWDGWILDGCSCRRWLSGTGCEQTREGQKK